MEWTVWSCRSSRVVCKILIRSVVSYVYEQLEFGTQWRTTIQACILHLSLVRLLRSRSLPVRLRRATPGHSDPAVGAISLPPSLSLAAAGR